MKKTVLLLLLLVMVALPAQRFVILEGFTNSGCGPCGPAYTAWMSVDDAFHENMGLILWHMSWPGSDPLYHYNPEDNDWRRNYYGISAVPATRCDGATINHNGAYSYVSTRIGVPSPLEIILDGNVTGNNGYFSARFEWVDSVEYDAYRAYFIIVENDLWAGGRHYDYTMRRVVDKVNLSETSGVQYFHVEFDVDPVWKLNDLIGYVVVQGILNKHVLQGARVDIGEWQSAVVETSWGSIKSMP